MIQPQIVLLKEGTDTSQGIPQLISNINAIESVCEILKSTLGPCGMDKLIWEERSVTITNDGATIINLLDIVHPAARVLVDIAKSQDSEVGDGTTSVCLLAGEFLKNVKGLLEDGLHPQAIMKGFRLASKVALDRLRQIAISIDRKDEEKHKEMLLRCAGTALNSKLISGQKMFFSNIAVNAVLSLDDDMDLKNVGIHKVGGGSVTDSIWVQGVAFKKTFSYAGFEQQPKLLKNPKIVLLNFELELKSERENAEIRIKDPSQYQSIVDAEWKLIYDRLDNLVKSGANIVLSKLPIGDLATQYFADREIFCAGRVPEEDLERVAKATGGHIQTSLQDLKAQGVLGSCALFEEKQVGGERYNFFTGCTQAKTATIILRGGAEQFMAESERSIHDALMIVKRARVHTTVVGGGGAIEMELSKHLRSYGKSLKSKLQHVVLAYAKAFEVIPRLLSANAGYDSTDIVNELRAKHSKAITWFGVDMENEGVVDTMKSFVWEPSLVKYNAISAATEAACMVLSVDETIRNPSSDARGGHQDQPATRPRARGGRKRELHLGEREDKPGKLDEVQQ